MKTVIWGICAGILLFLVFRARLAAGGRNIGLDGGSDGDCGGDGGGGD